MNSTETFIPYNQNKDYIMVEFVEMKKKEGDAFHNIMVVSYLNEDHELHWDHYHSYYTGKLGNIEGFIP
jgi:hypothetical protein